jgi:hypothetical protein
MKDGMLYYTAHRMKIVVLKSEMLFDASHKLVHYEEENEHQSVYAGYQQWILCSDSGYVGLLIDKFHEGKLLK